MQHEEKKSDSKRAIAVGVIVGKRWKVIRLLGEGGFGSVYEVRDTKTPLVNSEGSGNSLSQSKEETCAMKVEAANAPRNDQVLKMDVNILKRMAEKQSKHFCRLITIGITEKVHYMVTQLVGSNLHDMKKAHNGKFTFRTMAHIAINSLEALKELHHIGYIHRDLKPANLAIGRPPKLRELYLLDFGLSRQYRHEDGRLRRPRDRAGFRGTVRYAPLACHKQEETSRVTDLWNWLYVIIELTVGKLPWDHEIKRTRELPMSEMIERIGQIKEAFLHSPAELMDGCPREYLTLHDHISTLCYNSDPDYEAMLAALRMMETRRRQPIKDGETLDWESIKDSEPS